MKSVSFPTLAHKQQIVFGFICLLLFWVVSMSCLLFIFQAIHSNCLKCSTWSALHVRQKDPIFSSIVIEDHLIILWIKILHTDSYCIYDVGHTNNNSNLSHYCHYYSSNMQNINLRLPLHWEECTCSRYLVFLICSFSPCYGQHSLFPFLPNPMVQDLPIPLSEVHFNNKSDSHKAMSKTEPS
jgi:hypothetical protein